MLSGSIAQVVGDYAARSFALSVNMLVLALGTTVGKQNLMVNVNSGTQANDAKLFEEGDQLLS